jgi:phenylalanyl-tRNA synthetase beta chain
MGLFRPGTVPDHPLFGLEEDLRDLLVAEGLLEAQTAPFAPEEEGEVALSNPINVQEGFLRRDLLPGLLRRVEYNFARGVRDVRLFEMGTVFFRTGPGELPREETRLALVLTGDRTPLHWAEETEGVDVWDVKGLLGRLLKRARVQEGTVREGAPEERGMVGREGFTGTDEDDRIVAWGGRVEGKRLDAPAWAGAVYGLEMVLPSDPPPAPTPIFEEPPTFPGVDRDLALLVPKDLPARRVEDAIRESAGPLLVELVIFDLYEGKGIPEEMRSVAFRLRYQSRERTLTDEDVEDSVSAVVHRLREELGVRPRE